jgi:xanthine/uracil permease
MAKLGAVFLFGGFLLVFGAVGGMDNPDQMDYFMEQLAAAVTGLFLMLVGTSLLPREDL